MLTAGGFVRIGPAAGKGMGAFASRYMSPYYEIGVYTGEILRGEDALHARYGKLRGEVPTALLPAHEQWKRERAQHGVSTTGAYCLAAGTCPLTGNKIFVDAEDERVSSWTRYLNHSRKRANLSMGATVKKDGTPIVRFIVEKEIAPGDELLFDYGDPYWSHEAPIDEESWDDPRLW